MNPAFDKRVGQNIRALRIQRKMTQDDLAAKLQVSGCDMTRSTLAKVEAGLRHIYTDELYLIRNILRCSYEDLFREN